MALPGPHYHSRFTSNVADISPGIPCNTKFRMEFELYAILGIPDAWNGSLCTPVKERMLHAIPPRGGRYKCDRVNKS